MSNYGFILVLITFQVVWVRRYSQGACHISKR